MSDSEKWRYSMELVQYEEQIFPRKYHEFYFKDRTDL
jgi:hypothetical protein